MAKFADLETAKKLISKLYPSASSIQVIEHGYDNIVGLVDKKYAIRFPRYDKAYLRDLYEKYILRDLSSLKGIKIPKVLGEAKNPPYIITSYVHGNHLSEEEISNWSLKEQKEFAQDIAKLAFSIHSSLSIQRVLEFQKKAGLTDFSFIEFALENARLPTLKQDKIAKRYYSQWKKLQSKNPTIVTHNDLQTNNLMFINNKLSGVIDFGDAKVGRPEQDLRQMYRINDFILQSAVDEYEKISGNTLDINACMVWAITQELAAYSYRLIENQIDHPGFKRAVSHLQKWLPEGDWELLVEDKSTISQSKQ